MSIRVIQPLGQNQQRIQPLPIEQIQQQAYAGLQTFWEKIRQECEQHFTPSQCRALLGVRPTMLEPSAQEGIAWWKLVLIGVVIGKVVL